MSTTIRHVALGMLLGAGMTYFGDRTRGHQRRVKLRDALVSARRKERMLFGKAARDASYRIHGAIGRMRHPPEAAGVDDEVLVGRVRAQLGRVVSHAHAVEATVAEGVVCLRGPILEAEADRAVRDVSRVPGVSDVIDQLERHATAERIPALQGEARWRRNDQWTPAIRGGAVIGGAALALWGLFARRGLIRSLAMAGGSALAVRGGTNRSLEQLARLAVGRTGVDVHKTLRVNAPVEQVFRLWSGFENFPRFMQHVRKVEVSDIEPNQSRWTIDGPGNVPVTFDAEITRNEAQREITWRTLPGQRIAHMGSVRFEPGKDGTHVHVRLHYRPPAGLLGHAIGRVLGWDPKTRLDEDMVRMKALLEDGRTRAHGQHVALSDIR